MVESIDELFKNTICQMQFIYSQNHDEKGDSWCKMKTVDLRVKFFKEYHEFVDAINTPSMTEVQRYFELIDTLLVGLMLAERWFPELIASMKRGRYAELR